MPQLAQTARETAIGVGVDAGGSLDLDLEDLDSNLDFSVVSSGSGAKKEPQSQKIARTAPKNFLNNSNGLPVITHQNKGFEAHRTRKFTRKFGENLCRKSSLGYLFCP